MTNPRPLEGGFCKLAGLEAWDFPQYLISVYRNPLLKPVYETILWPV